MDSAAPAPSVCAVADIDVDPDAEAAVDAALLAQMEAFHTPGLAVAIVRGGRVLWSRGYGLANVETGVAVDADTTPFMLASISKTVTVTAVLQAVEQGDLDLDADVGEIAGFPVRHPAYPDDVITLRMLLIHTSSIRDNWAVWEDTIVEGDSDIALGDFLSGYFTDGGTWNDPARSWRSSQPGTVYEYSNIGAALAGYLVEAATGTPFDQWGEEHIFTPMGMDHTAWHLAGLDEAQVAMPYAWTGEGYDPYGHYGYPDYPDGQLRSTATELGCFLAAWSHGGGTEGVGLVDVEMASAALSEQAPDAEGAAGQGFIWYSWDRDGETVWGHSGSDSGVATEMYFRPSDGLGVLVLMNMDWGRAAIAEDMEATLWDFGATLEAP